MSTQTIGRRNEADWASIVVGLGLGLTVAMFVETTTREDWNSVYAVVTSISRIAALVGSYLALIGLVLVSRISWVEKSVGHDRMVIWHRKLGPYSLYLITVHVLFVLVGYATVVGPDGGLADALATALIVAGRDGAKWFSRSELAKYSAWVIDRHEEVAWSVGLGHG